MNQNDECLTAGKGCVVLHGLPIWLMLFVNGIGSAKELFVHSNDPRL